MRAMGGSGFSTRGKAAPTEAGGGHGRFAHVDLVQRETAVHRSGDEPARRERRDDRLAPRDETLQQRVVAQRAGLREDLEAGLLRHGALERDQLLVHRRGGQLQPRGQLRRVGVEILAHRIAQRRSAALGA